MIQGVSLRRLKGFKEVFMTFKLAIINSNTHTLPLGHLKVTLSVKYMHFKNMYKRKFKMRLEGAMKEFRWP